MHALRFAVALVVISTACGTAQVSPTSAGTRNRSTLSFEEIQASRSHGWSAYDLLANLRPEFLRSRGAVSLRDATQATAAVYLDGLRYGELQILKTIGVDQIFSIGYINAADATTRFGTDHFGGAILIRTR